MLNTTGLKGGCHSRVRIPVALRASAHRGLGDGEDVPLVGLRNLGVGEDETTDEAESDGRNAAERDRGVEEDETADGNGKLVQGSNHGVGRRGGHSDAPCRAVGDEDGAETGVHHAEEQRLARLDGEVPEKVLGRPILSDQGADNEHGDSKEVVVEHGCSINVSHLRSVIPNQLFIK